MQFSLSVNSVKRNSYRIKMRYSIEPRERRHVKGYGFLSFARNIGTHVIIVKGTITVNNTTAADANANNTEKK